MDGGSTPYRDQSIEYVIGAAGTFGDEGTVVTMPTAYSSTARFIRSSSAAVQGIMHVEWLPGDDGNRFYYEVFKGGLPSNYVNLLPTFNDMTQRTSEESQVGTGVAKMHFDEVFLDETVTVVHGVYKFNISVNQGSKFFCAQFRETDDAGDPTEATGTLRLRFEKTNT